MTIETSIVTHLEADATLTALLTGGLYSSTETGRLGISIDSTPDAYDNGFLLPCAIVKARALTPTNELADADGQFMTTRQVIEVWLYDDGRADYSTLEAARSRIYALLQDQHEDITGAVSIQWAGNLDDLRDETLHNACLLRQDWQVNSYKST